MNVRIGTSAFTAAGWEGVFYPEGMKPADYLSYYAEHFDTVEVDSTFYRTPAASTVRKWYQATPAGFLFSAKVPQAITHEKRLEGCEEEFARFVETMQQGLGEKLGVLLLQFPYFNKKAFATAEPFLARLEKFLEEKPDGRLAVEVRNKGWLGPRLLEMLRARGVALACLDHPWMPRPLELLEKCDPVTADFAYIRLLGDRYGIEEKTKTWDKVIVERRREIGEWKTFMTRVKRGGEEFLIYVNNHYAGHAPATARQLMEAMGTKAWSGAMRSASGGTERLRFGRMEVE